MIEFTLLFLLGLKIIFFEYYRYFNNLNNRFDVLFFVNFFFLVYYVITILLVEINEEIIFNLLNYHYLTSYKPILTLNLVVCIYISWFSIIIGFYFFRMKNKKNILKNNNIIASNKFYLQYIGVLVFCGIFFYSLFLYFYGFSALTTNIRFGTLGKSHLGTFFLIMSDVFIYAFFILFLFFFILEKKTFKLNIVLFIFSLFVFNLSIQGGGRGGMIKPFLMIFLIYLNYKNRLIFNKFFFLFLILFFFFSMFGRSVFAYYLSIGEYSMIIPSIKTVLVNSHWSDLFNSLISEFSYPYISLSHILTMNNLNELDYRYFKDIPNGFLFYLRMIGIDTDYSISYYNTFNLQGIFASFVPPGFVALGFYSFGLLGIFILSFLYGILLKFIKRLFDNLPQSSPFVVYKLLIGFGFSSFIGNADLRVILLKLLPIFFGIFLFFF